jgi:hypothetical protein
MQRIKWVSFFWYWSLNSGPSPWVTPFFVKGFFKIGSPKLVIWGWLRTAFLLISASWVGRITNVSHWHLAYFFLEQTCEHFCLLFPFQGWCWGLTLPLYATFRTAFTMHTALSSPTLCDPKSFLQLFLIHIMSCFSSQCLLTISKNHIYP